jgi:hypothetical protein
MRKLAFLSLAFIVALSMGGCVTAKMRAQRQMQDADSCTALGFKPGTENFLGCLRLKSNERLVEAAQQQQAMQDFGNSLQALGTSIRASVPPPPRATNTNCSFFVGQMHCTTY